MMQKTLQILHHPSLLRQNSPDGDSHIISMLTRFPFLRTFISALLVAGTFAVTAAAENPFIGGWALTLPNGTAGWLGVEETNGALQASLLWSGGSVLPLASAKMDDGKLIVTRVHSVQKKDENGKTVKTDITETITATVEGDEMKLTTTHPRDNGKGEVTEDFTGQRVPPVPPAPDLSKLEFGAPIKLFNGKDLTGWRLTNPKAANGWKVKNGILINEVVQEKGKPHKTYGNLRTDQEFNDFNITLETRVAEGGNSGVYLRGIYEVQVFDSYGKPLDPHNMGAIYSRVTPTQAAEKPAGQWQTLDITLADRHATVILNGKKIIDNQPLLGCTGGALWSDVTRPGPIYLQGDHTGIEYRNIVLRPVVK